jgi:hypothetical protein
MVCPWISPGLKKNNQSRDRQIDEDLLFRAESGKAFFLCTEKCIIMLYSPIAIVFCTSAHENYGSAHILSFSNIRKRCNHVNPEQNHDL